jgi:hypothetical protein
MEILKGKYYRTKGTNKDVVRVLKVWQRHPNDWDKTQPNEYHLLQRVSDKCFAYMTSEEFFTYIEPLPISNQQVAQILYGSKGEVRNEN